MSAALEPFVRALVRALQPLKSAFDDPRRFGVLIRNLGWEADVSTLILSNGKIGKVATDLGKLLTEGEQLLDKLETSSNKAEIVGELLDVALQGGELVASLGKLTAADLSSLPVAFRDPAFWAELALDLPEYLLIRYLMVYEPAWAAFLQLLGLLRVTRVEPDTAQGGLVKVAFWRRELVWDNLTAMLSDPGAYFKARYQWNDPSKELLHAELLGDLGRLLLALGLRSRMVDMRASLTTAHYGATPSAGVRELDVPLFSGMTPVGFGELGLLLAPVPSKKGGGLDGILLANLSYGEVSAGQDLGGGFTLLTAAGADASGSFGLAVYPTGPKLVGAVPDGWVSVDLVGAPETPWRVFGAETGPRLELSGLRAGVAFDGSSTPDARVSFDLVGPDGEPGLALIVSAAEADGFLADVLGDAEIRAEFGLELCWSAREGLTVGGALALETTIPVGRTWGPLTLDEIWLHLGAQFGDEPGALLAAAVTASFELGPFVASVERLGAGLSLVPAADGKGVFGKLDLVPVFVPPVGLGLAIQSDVVSGGGFLKLDNEKGEYAGVLELSFAGIGLVAIGVLTTKLPDGSKGWSLYLGITCELPNIQLGYGFTLNGVGGLIAINRTVDSDAMRLALRDGGMNSVLFPEDPIKNAPTILRNIGAFFPIQTGTVLFGPMIAIGWGTPTLIQGELGIILVIPEWRILVLGSLTCTLPTPEAALIRIHMDVLGEIDFPAGTVSVDASLYDSSIVGIALSGDMAFRASFIENPDFLLSVGGFHPDYQVPAQWASLADMRRMQASLRLSDKIYLSLEAYFAITSNTLQFGAAARVSATALGFTAEGGIYVDALIIFQPFGFQANCGAYVALRRGNWDLFSVHLDLLLKGPKPWYARGTATFRALGKDWDFQVEASSGGGFNQGELERVAVLDQVIAELDRPESWAEAAGSARCRGVGASAPERGSGDTVVWARPDSRVEVRQKVAPLSPSAADPIVLEHFGAYEIAGASSFVIEKATLSGLNAAGTAVQDYFAPASFFDYSEDERLSAPSFESMPCGLAFGDEELELPGANLQRTLAITYEEERWDELGRGAGKGGTRTIKLLPFDAMALSIHRAGSTVGKAETARPSAGLYGVSPLRFGVVREGAAKALTGAVPYYAARAALKTQQAATPRSASGLRIVPLGKESA